MPSTPDSNQRPYWTPPPLSAKERRALAKHVHDMGMLCARIGALLLGEDFDEARARILGESPRKTDRVH